MWGVAHEKMWGGGGVKLENCEGVGKKIRYMGRDKIKFLGFAKAKITT